MVPFNSTPLADRTCGAMGTQSATPQHRPPRQAPRSSRGSSRGRALATGPRRASGCLSPRRWLQRRAAWTTPTLIPTPTSTSTARCSPTRCVALIAPLSAATLPSYRTIFPVCFRAAPDDCTVAPVRQDRVGTEALCVLMLTETAHPNRRPSRCLPLLHTCTRKAKRKLNADAGAHGGI